MEPIALTWTLAILIGATSTTILGSMLALQKKRPWGYLINTSGLIAFWLAALMPYLHAQRPEGEPRPVLDPDTLLVSHVSAADVPASLLQPLGSGLDPVGSKFIASRNGKTYHLPSCSHYAPYIRGGIWYDSTDAAEADGKRPCSECLGK